MYSLNLDYIFNSVYSFLLWIRFFWVFTVWRETPEAYLQRVESHEWDGLRDRGYISDLIEKRSHISYDDSQGIISYVAEKFGFTLPDSDKDGIPDVYDNTPYDPENLTAIELKERFQNYYGFLDHVRGFLGFGPVDSDNDGLPNSYERYIETDIHNPDTDEDGVFDANELVKGIDPKNPDTDGDGVLDGRDAYPLDPLHFTDGVDSDHDGLSDTYEKSMGTHKDNLDTDNDGIPDGSDAFPLDPHNKTHGVALSDYTRNLDGLHFAIQNPVLQFVRDIFSVLSLIGLVFLSVAFMRFLRDFWTAQMHYEHHFGHGGDHDDSHGTSHGKEKHQAHHTKDIHNHNEIDHDVSESHVIEGLAITENLPFEIENPTEKDFEKHPKWAIIEGYMSGESEALWRIGILEADMMLRDVLLERGYQGVDVGELLQASHFETITLAWDAHKVRNRIAHEGSDYLLTDREARRVFSMYEAVFKELKVI